ncbi:hypothetical protein [Pseudooceanicola algae]|uniref:hypothetical protein n=1 Tax=Pseudooceanicola algae TaxID=1537215 RepID=UPI0018AD19DA|nr:hypothetical protein [Pseudooceanicola algae]
MNPSQDSCNRAIWVSVSDSIREKMEARDVLTHNPMRKIRKVRIGVGYSWYYLHNLGSGPIDFRGRAWFTARKLSGDMSDLFWLGDALMARLGSGLKTTRRERVGNPI